MALYTQLSPNDIRDILKTYPTLHNRFFKAKGIALGTVNTFYKLTFSPREIYYLKIDEVGQKRRLHDELAIFDNLKSAAASLPFEFPYPLMTNRNKAYTLWKQKLCLVFPELKGKSIYPQQLTPSHLQKIGDLLARWHKIQPSNAVKPHRFDLKGQQKVFREILPKLKSKHPDLVPKIQAVFQRLKSQTKEKSSLRLLHADAFAENFMWQGSRLTGILDFDAAGLGRPGFDLGVAIHALCHTKTGFDLNKIIALLKGYTQVRKLSRNEQKHFWNDLDAAALRFLLTRLRDFELKEGPVKAKPFKNYKEFVQRFEENAALKQASQGPVPTKNSR